jgi:hypothetical protein
MSLINSLLTFIKDMLPSFSRMDLQNDVQSTKEELTKTKSVYATAVEFYKKRKLTSPELTYFINIFELVATPAQQRAGMLVTIDDTIDKFLKNIETLEDLILTEFDQEIVRAGITYRQTQIIRYCEVAAFFARYSRKILNFTFDVETLMLPEYKQEERVMTKAEYNWLKNNAATFFDIIAKTNGIKPDQLEKLLKAIPDIIVEGSNQELLGATVGVKALDPLSTNFLPPRLNPFVWLGKSNAHALVQRYESAQEDLRMAQLLMYNLQRNSEGKPDAQVQKQIGILAAEIQKMEYKIAQMEKQHGWS